MLYNIGFAWEKKKSQAEYRRFVQKYMMMEGIQLLQSHPVHLLKDIMKLQNDLDMVGF